MWKGSLYRSLKLHKKTQHMGALKIKNIHLSSFLATEGRSLSIPGLIPGCILKIGLKKQWFSPLYQ